MRVVRGSKSNTNFNLYAMIMPLTQISANEVNPEMFETKI